MSTPSPVRPRLIVLSLEQIEQVHAQSLEILARVGLRIDSPRAVQVLSAANGVKFLAPDHAVFQPELEELLVRGEAFIRRMVSRLSER